MRTKRALRSLAAVTSAALVIVGMAPAVAGTSTVGASGAGDPYFPRQGNGGYRIAHYDLAIDYRPATHHLAGRAHLVGRTTKDLSRFDLDLRHDMQVQSVRVNGAPAAFAQPAAQVQELVITPASLVLAGHRLVVTVRYAGIVRHVTDPDGSADGFIVTGDGAFVANEPQGAPSWFPVNDTPTDKATYHVSATVPQGLVAVSNGAFLGKSTANGRTTWRWAISKPISSYLVTATIGRFNLRRGTTPSGIPYFDAFDPAEQAAAMPVVNQLPQIIDFFSQKYGAYPFGSAGAIVDHARFVGYALETATRPLFDRAPDISPSRTNSLTSGTATT
jgi:aminopeptidase N